MLKQRTIMSRLMAPQDPPGVEERLKSGLLAAVARRRSQRRSLKLAVTCALVVASGALLITRESLQFPIASTQQEQVPAWSLAQPEATSSYTVVDVNVVPEISKPAVSLQLLDSSQQAQFIVTRPLGVTIVTDNELESTFSHRAYALAQDSENNITVFHLLDKTRVEESGESVF